MGSWAIRRKRIIVLIVVCMWGFMKGVHTFICPGLFAEIYIQFTFIDNFDEVV